jgi:hypothetical protein
MMSTGVGSAARVTRRVLRRVERTVRPLLHLHQSEQTIAADAQALWNDDSRLDHRSDSHWRGAGPFRDDELWLSLGRQHLELVERTASWAQLAFPVERVIEWGVGGGMNAIHLAPHAEEFIGVDVAETSLREFERQLGAIGARNGRSVLVDVRNPEMVNAQVPAPCDIFISTYVFELLPTPEYGISVMRIAAGLLRRGGIALIQIRYHERASESSRRFRYRENVALMTTYTIPGFWTAMTELGLRPLFVQLLPTQPELNERRYAYFGLVRQ